MKIKLFAYIVVLLQVILYVFLLQIQLTDGSKLPIKIVEEPANYANNLGAIDLGDKLTTKVKPSNFSGPAQLRLLHGKCFNWTDEKYRYNFCPFNNITQHEMSLRWNVYQGILGVWEEWEIQNNSFSAMIYGSGSECGETDRYTTVVLQCGQQNALLNVSEPSKCHYEASFSTPLVCHEDALLVYPRLQIHLQEKWDDLENQLKFGDITNAGYMGWLQEIFLEAGFKIKKQTPTQATRINTTINNTDTVTQFSDVVDCTAAFTRLKNEVKLLKEELEKIKKNGHTTADGKIDL